MCRDLPDISPLPGNEAALRSARTQVLRWTGWFVVGNTALLLLVAMRDWQSAGWPSEWLARFFLLLAFVGHFFSIALALNVPAAVAALLWPSRWLAGILAVVLSSLGALIVLVDSIVFHLFRFHLNGMVWSLIRQGDISQELPLSPQTWLIAAFLVAVECRRGNRVGSASRPLGAAGAPGRLVVGLMLVGTAVTTQLAHAWADAAHYTPITRIARNLPAFRPLTARKVLRKLGVAVASQDASMRLPRAQSALRYPAEALSEPVQMQPLNLVLLVIDGWRFDMLTQAVTPNLFVFSQQNLRFEHHSSAANATTLHLHPLLWHLWHLLGADAG